jgi:hypothetical protein
MPSACLNPPCLFLNNLLSCQIITKLVILVVPSFNFGPYLSTAYSRTLDLFFFLLFRNIVLLKISRLLHSLIVAVAELNIFTLMA